MLILTGLLLGCSGGAFAAAFFRRRIEITLPAALMTNALALYGCFLLKIPVAGVWGIAAVNLVLLIAGLWRAKRNRGQFCRYFFTPGLAAFSFWSLVLLLLSIGRQFDSWDEFTHWGCVAKMTFLTGRLSCEYGTALEHAYYPPIMPVWQYFYSSFSGGFSEAAVIYGTNQLLVSFFLPGMLRVNWRNWRSSIWYTLLILLMPLGFLTAFYTVYVDGVLAAVMSYALALILLYKRANFSRIWYLSAAMAFMALVKDSGKGLAALVLLTALVQILVSPAQRRNWRSYLTVVCPALFMLLVAYSWKYLIDLYECHVIFSSAKISAAAIWNAFVHGEVPYAREVLLRWTLRLISGNPVEVLGDLHSWRVVLREFNCGWLVFIPAHVRLAPLPLMICFSGILLYVRQFCTVVQLRKNLLLAAVMFPVTGMLFAVTMLIYYVFSFTRAEALILASFERYMSTVLLAEFLAALFLIRQAVPHRKSIAQKRIWCIWYILLLLPLLCWPDMVFGIIRSSAHNYTYRRQGMDLVAAQLTPHLRQGETIAVVDQGSFGEFFWHMQYTYSPQLDLKQPYSVRHHETVRAAKGRKNEYAKVISPENYIQRCQQNELLYCRHADSYFRRTYGKVFASPIRDGRVYRLHQGKYHLLPLKDVVLDFENYCYLVPDRNSKKNFTWSDGFITCRTGGKQGNCLLQIHSHVTVVNDTPFKELILHGNVRGEAVTVKFHWKNKTATPWQVTLPPGKNEYVIALPPSAPGKFALEFSSTAPAEICIDEVILRAL